MTVKIYKPRPYEVEAMRIDHLDYDMAKQVTAWCRNAYVRVSDGHLVVNTENGDVSLSRGDYLVQGWGGKFTVVSGIEFESNYEVQE